MDNVKRKYDSSRRREQAEATRERLTAAARRLFVRDGYPAATIAAIAQEAGTSVPTFYAIYGSKRNVLFALLDAMEADANAANATRELEAATDPRTQLRLLVAFHVRLFALGADLLRALRSAGNADPELADLWREGEARRMGTEEPFVRRWFANGALGGDLSVSEAVDVFWAMTSPDVFALFVDERRWTTERYGAWLDEHLATLLFGQNKATH